MKEDAPVRTVDFRAVFESAPDAVLVVLPDDPMFTMVAASDGYLRLSGVAREDLLGRGIFQVFPDSPENAGASGAHTLRASFQRALASRSPDQFALQRYDAKRSPLQGSGFEKRYWSVANTPTLRADGQVEYILHSVREVTEVVHAEEREHSATRELHTSETRFRQLAEASTFGLLIADLEGGISYLNPTLRQLLGYSEQEVAEGLLRWDRITPPEFAPLDAEAVVQLTTTGRCQPFEKVYLAKDGRPVPILVAPSILDATGGRTEVAAFILDLTERKRIEQRNAFLLRLDDATRSLVDADEIVRVAAQFLREHLLQSDPREESELLEVVAKRSWESLERARVTRELRDSEQRLRLSQRAARIGTFEWLMDTGDIIWTPELEELYGLPAGAFEGSLNDWSKRVVPEDAERVIAGLQETMAKRRTEYAYEFRAVLPDGTLRWLEGHAQLFCSEAGEPIRMIGVNIDINGRKQSEAVLQQQWHSFDTALSNTPDFIYTFDLQGKLTYVNRALLSLWRKTLEEAVGKNFFELDYPPELADRLQRQIRTVIESKQRLRDETPFAGAAGETRTYEYIFVPVLGADGQVEAVAGSTRDITERYQAAALIQEDRRRWRELLEQAPAAIAVLRGPEHRFEWVNRGYVAIVSRRAMEELVGKTVAEALPELATQSFPSMFDRVYRTGEPFVAQEALARVGTSEGNLRDVYVNYVCLATRDSEGRIDGVFVHATDVTEVVTARKQAEESEERFRQLANSMPQIVWTARPDGYLDYYNERWYEFTGFDRSLGGDQSWDPILHPDDKQGCYDAWYGTIRSGEPYQIEYRFWDRHENRWRWFMGQALPAHDSSGQVVKWFGSCTDIDELRQSQQAVLQAQKLESIGLLAGGVAHDFNNLLAGIMGGASFALETVARAHPAYPLLQGVVEASERAAHLTRQMLAYAGKGTFFIEPVNLSNIVVQTTELVSASIPKSVHVTLQLDEHLPAVHTDAGQMQQVAMNLIINAAEAIGEERNGLVVVRTRAEEIRAGGSRRDVSGNPIAPGLYAVLEVEDTGGGIDPNVLTKIFDPFFTTKFTGRGLGLAAVHGIVRSHVGAIEVDTTPGKGSTFRVLLPAKHTAVGAGPRTGPEAAAQGKEIVLAIDDEAMVRNVVKAALEKSGYGALLATGGEQGLELIRQHEEISLVLLDMSMPEMSGRQVLERLQTIRPELPVIICSGYSEDEIYRQFSGLEIAGVLQKPFTTRRLAAKVRSTLDGVRVV